MRKLGYTALIGLLAATAASPTHADVTTDHAAAILIFPRILATELRVLDGSPNRAVTDTIVQITNTTNDPVSLHCFYINANSHCSISNSVCGERVPCPLPQDLCLPGWIETDFDVNITGQQPVGWRASAGLSRAEFPLDGVAFNGPTGQNNAGSAVPPVPLEETDIGAPNTLASWTGELKCVVVDGSGHAIADSAVKGEATVINQLEFISTAVHVLQPSAEKYNAIGIEAIEGDANEDGVLVLGGDANEYNGCPNVLVVDHFFDFAVTEAFGVVESELTLVPCAQNLREQIPGSTTAQFLVFNEFEQRFSTSRGVDCYFKHRLSLIDTPDPSRSIFSVNVAGTVAGQTRIRGVSGGLLGILSEVTSAARGTAGVFPFAGFDDAVNVHVQGDRAAPDLIVLP